MRVEGNGPENVQDIYGHSIETRYHTNNFNEAIKSLDMLAFLWQKILNQIVKRDNFRPLNRPTFVHSCFFPSRGEHTSSDPVNLDFVINLSLVTSASTSIRYGTLKSRVVLSSNEWNAYECSCW